MMLFAFMVSVCSMTALSLWQPQTALVVFTGLVLLFGVPHGALDLWVMRRLHRSLAGWLGLLAFAYVALAGLVLVGFYYWPTLLFTIFLAYSAFHFGMDYYPSSTPARMFMKTSYALLVGLCLVSFPSFLYQADVAQLFRLVLPPAAALRLSHVLHMVAPAFAVGLLCLSRLTPPAKRLELALALTTSLAAPPLAYLTVYFIGVHSRQHFLLLYRSLGYSSLSNFIRDILPMTLLSYLLAGGIYFLFFPDLQWQHKSFAAVIYLLAALTLPHLILVEMMKRQATPQQAPHPHH